MPEETKNPTNASPSAEELLRILAEKEAALAALQKNKEQQEFKMARLTEENSSLKREQSDVVAETVLKTTKIIEEKSAEAKRAEILETELSALPEEDREAVRENIKLTSEKLDVKERVKVAHNFVVFNKIPEKTRQQMDEAKRNAGPIKTNARIDITPDGKPINMDNNGKTISGYDRKTLDLARDILTEMKTNKQLRKGFDVDSFLGRIN